MHSTLRLLYTGIICLICANAMAQTAAKGCKPPINRARWHDLIDREQKAILRADNKSDNLFQASEDEEINYFVTNALIQRTDLLQCKIESDTLTNHQKKVAYLDGLYKSLLGFEKYFRSRQIIGSQLPTLLDTYERAMNLDRENQSLEALIEKVNYEVGSLIINSGAFNDNVGYKPTKYILVRKYTHAHPERIFETLNDFPDLPFRDSLILVGAYKNPKRLYDFAAANNRLGYAIRKLEDPMIQAVSKMATSGGSGQLYFPFLDNIVQGKQTIADIDAVKNDDVKYYRLLVKTRLDYLDRQLKGEKLYGMEALDERMSKKAREYFVKTINALHNESDAVRFRILGQLNAQELYYLIVLSESEIYTSSYTKGVYPAVMQKIGNRGDSLLMTVGFDKYKKFIKMAAGFNTLSHFLGTFPDQGQSDRLMTAFVNGLEKSSGLEDGVDVADSYASIAETIKPLASRMLQNVKLNYDRNLEQNNAKGIVIYNLLYKLFLSADTTNKVDLSKEFGIPPVYNVSYNSLATDSGRVVMQVFFYGDEDGRHAFQGFNRQFGSNWKRTETKQWVTFSSTSGKPVYIFANKPLPEEKNEDAEAQAALGKYLAEKGLSPGVVIHRGHSYYAPYTIKQITPSAKVVFLGSCGGYHLIHDVLHNAPDAHIISSKQIGKTVINQPFIDLLTEKVRNGSSIDWIPFWNEFKANAGRVEGFEDYIPPHKNLGAIFIKAYKIQTGESGD